MVRGAQNWVRSSYVPSATSYASEEVKRGAQKLTAENLQLVLGRVFNYKLGCFNDVHVFVYVDACPHL